MARKIITAFITKNGNPETGLSPTVDVWELDPVTPTSNTLIINNGTTTEIGGGWYRYDFLTYDFTKNYTFTFDAGVGMSPNDRYHAAVNESYGEDIAYLTWEETASTHMTADTTGLLQNQTAADAAQIRIDVLAAKALIETLLKYQRNRTKIDKTAKTLTVYDDDNTTVLKVFDLKDASGNPSIIEICERLPQ